MTLNDIVPQRDLDPIWETLEMLGNSCVRVLERQFQPLAAHLNCFVGQQHEIMHKERVEMRSMLVCLFVIILHSAAGGHGISRTYFLPTSSVT